MAEEGINAALKTCAVECALKRLKHKCKNRFGSMACNGCKYNIAEYADADPRHLKLFMLSAEQEAEHLHWQSRSHHPIFAAAIIVCLLLALYFHNRHARVGLRVPSTVTSVTKPQAPKSDVQMIRETLNAVSLELGRKVDVNKDGLINCIDAAVLFYQHYPDRKKCWITLNYNKKTGMNHLFNTVLIDGVWRGVEPQAVYGGYKSFYMSEIWGKQYDTDCNEGATSDYVRYVK